MRLNGEIEDIMSSSEHMTHEPIWWHAMVQSALKERWSIESVLLNAKNEERRETLSIQKTGYLFALSIFNQTKPHSGELPDAFLNRVEIAVKEQAAQHGNIARQGWEDFLVGIEWLLFAVQRKSNPHSRIVVPLFS